MSNILAELEQKAGHLTPTERAQLVLFLIQSLDPSEEGDIEEAWRVEAEAEFAAAALFYESRLVGLGSSFVREVEQVVAFIRAHSDAGSPLG